MTWEDTFKSWGAAPSVTEQQKMENAKTAIIKAVKSNTRLAGMDISIIPQGSYRARTNVKQDSDVDICICLNSTFFPRYPIGRTGSDYAHIDGTITFNEFKKLIDSALCDYFGYQNITPGNKAFDIHSNSYRVDADVIPAFSYRYYYGDGIDEFIQPAGIAFNPDNGNRIVNWPHHTYQNGIVKQENTGKRYKKMVRILKRLRNKMQDEHIVKANDVASFLIESLVWNVPDQGFNHATYKEDVMYVLAHCFNETLLVGAHEKMYEVNGQKLLFGDYQPWTREQAHQFCAIAWDYIGFK